jgi:hypothetical protein
MHTPPPNTLYDALLADPSMHDKPFWYGSLYSCPGHVWKFLIRVEPYTAFLVSLNRGFGLADRIVYEWQREFQSACTMEQNLEELIPEVFVFPELFQNVNEIELPNNSMGISTSTFQIDPQFQNCAAFVANNRRELNESTGIHQWIDLIFGYCSRGPEAVQRKNLFPSFAYGHFDKDMNDASEVQMREYGTVPIQLFSKAHDPRIVYTSAFILPSFSQKLSSVSIPSEDFDILLRNDGDFKVIPIIERYRLGVQSNQNCIPTMNDGVFKWSIESFTKSCFSKDSLFFCGIVGAGTIVLGRSIFSDGKIQSIIDFGSCFIPLEFYHDITHPFISCCISSHLNLVCESSDRFIFTFHISSCNFIRKLTCNFSVNFLLICDSTHLIFALGEHEINVFTVNGTTFAGERNIETITAAGISTGEFPYLVTGHSNGSLRFWTLNFNGKLTSVNVIAVSQIAIRGIEVVHHGQAVIIIDQIGETWLHVVPGMRKPIINREFVAGCMKCSRKSKKNDYTACSFCGLWFCKKHIKKDLCEVCAKT